MQFLQDATRIEKLSYLHCLFVLALASVGLVLIILSPVFDQQWTLQPGQHALRAFALKKRYLPIGLALGSTYLVVSLVGLLATLRIRLRTPKFYHPTLSTYSWLLVFLMLLNKTVATLVWIDTLQERARYAQIWSDQLPSMRTFLQDQLQCCGYWNGTPDGGLRETSVFCQDVAQAIMSTPCVTPITQFADNLLNAIFTTIYGFVAILISAFLTSICLTRTLNQEHRFRKLDERDGGQGAFV